MFHEDWLPAKSVTNEDIRFMDVLYIFQGAEFEWDANKASSNLRKHGITFEEATEVFFDPFFRMGEASVDEERRDFILGYSLSQQILLVVFTERNDRTRIISARRATRAERKAYEQA
jgi:uncharacterized DUF497 family protein